MRQIAAALVFVAGCAAPVVGADAGRDAAFASDAAIESDAFTAADAAAPDAYVAPDAFAGDAFVAACDIYANTGCAAGLTCRLSDDGHTTPHIGPPACESFGSLPEGDTGGVFCFASDGVHDLCSSGLYCAGLACYRYCDATHPTCTPLHGSPQHCDLSATPTHCTG